LSAGELSFLLLLCDAYKDAFVRSFLKRRITPIPVVITVEDILRAQEAALSTKDRRWISTAMREYLDLIIHIGGRSQVNLPLIDGAFADREIKRYVANGLLNPFNNADGGAYELGASLSQMAGSLFTWISLVSMHDVQVVGGTASAPQGVEEVLLFITTGSTIWLLASEGLSNAGEDLSPIRFGLRSLDTIDCLQIADEFFKPLEDVSIPEQFYNPVEVLMEVDSITCPHCGGSLTTRKKFCVLCGGPLTEPG
jgi:hypothetical protein